MTSSSLRGTFHEECFGGTSTSGMMGMEVGDGLALFLGFTPAALLQIQKRFE
jgi:hypothetical protein